MRTFARLSAGNSTSTPSPSSLTSTPRNSCRLSCGVRPSRRRPQLARPAATTERGAAQEALRVNCRAGYPQGTGGGLGPEFRGGVGGEDALPGRPARGALTAAPAGLGGAPPVWELPGLGRLGREELRPGDPGTLAPPRKAAVHPRHRNRMGPGQPWANQCHEAQKWGPIGPEVGQEDSVRA